MLKNLLSILLITSVLSGIFYLYSHRKKEYDQSKLNDKSIKNSNKKLISEFPKKLNTQSKIENLIAVKEFPSEDTIREEMEKNPKYRKILDMYSKTDNELIDKYISDLEYEQEIFLEDTALTRGQLIAEGLDPDMDGLENIDDNSPIIDIGFMVLYDNDLDGTPVDENTEVLIELDELSKKKIEIANSIPSTPEENEYISEYIDEIEFRHKLSEALSQENGISFGQEL